MKKEIFEMIKKELVYIGLMFILVLIIFKIAFYSDNWSVLLRNVLSLFWLFVLPGYSLMIYWIEKLEFIERVIIGTILSAGIIGILSYYVGLIGLNIKYHTLLLPLILILMGLVVMIKKE